MSRRSFVLGAAAAGLGSAIRPAHAHLPEAGGCSWPKQSRIRPSDKPNEIVRLPYDDGVYIQAAIVFNLSSKVGVTAAQVLGPAVGEGMDTIVVNLGGEAPLVVELESESAAAPLRKAIGPRMATIVASDKVQMLAGPVSPGDAVHAAFLRTASPRNLANVLNERTRWRSYSGAGCWPAGIGPFPLWMSRRAVIIGPTIAFDPWRAANQPTPPGQGRYSFDLHTNLWWLPAMSDAAIHHCHYENFLEIHTQLLGLGRMQKFADLASRGACPDSTVFPQATTLPPPNSGFYGVPGIHAKAEDFPGLFEEYRLAPADSNVPFPYVSEDVTFRYPWHQYYADTDCLWVAWEFVPRGPVRGG
jgi:hypothetical protein